MTAPMTNNAALILTGATIVGGFFLGKAVVDHVLLSEGQASLDDDAAEFEEQHYRAAGFRRKSRPQLDNAVAIVAGLVGVGSVIYQAPELIQGLQALAK